MVDPKNFDRVRIVRDRSMEEDDPLPEAERGTKVFTDILEADPDSLFPLQGALGYDIAQTLFIGPNSLIVEGVSDLLYLPSVSGALESHNREGLSDNWTITPVGGSDKVPTFVSLLGSQKNAERCGPHRLPEKGPADSREPLQEEAAEAEKRPHFR